MPRTLTQLDKSPEATGELESPWCAGENPGVSPRDFDQRACRTSRGCTSGVCGGIRLFTSEVYRSPRRQCEAHDAYSTHIAWPVTPMPPVPLTHEGVLGSEWRVTAYPEPLCARIGSVVDIGPRERDRDPGQPRGPT